MSQVLLKKEMTTVTLAKSLKKDVDSMIWDDPKFQGLARYLTNVTFFWATNIETACAGHGYIFFNPTFYEEMLVESRKSIIAHEVWHLILKHLERGKLFDPYIFNIAADHVINLGLVQEGFTFEGVDGLMDAEYLDMSTEEVYNKIYKLPPEERPDINVGSINTPGQIENLIKQALEAKAEDDEANGEPEKTPADIGELKEASDEVVRTFTKPGVKCGNHGLTIERTQTKVVIQDATYPEIFKNYLIDPLGGGKRSFMRPNRRQTSGKLVLPGRLKRKSDVNRLTHLVYALDVSGSISKKQAQQFHDSVRTIKQLMNPKRLTVLFFDTRIVLERTFQDTEPYGTIHVKAGGGTCLKDVYARTAEINPEALVIFTDMCLTVPDKPSWDSIWLVTTAHVKAPKDLYGDIYLIPELD